MKLGIDAGSPSWGISANPPQFFSTKEAPASAYVLGSRHRHIQTGITEDNNKGLDNIHLNISDVNLVQDGQGQSGSRLSPLNG